MTLSVKHKFISAKADGTDNTLVKPSNWNDLHDLESDTDGFVLGRQTGLGSGPVIEIPMATLMGLLVPPGTIWLHGGIVAPTGWIYCEGQVLNMADYPALGAVFLNRFGGNGTTTFALPDMRGRVPAHPDKGVGRLTTNSINNPNVPGGVGGAEWAQVRHYGIVDVGGGITTSGSLWVEGDTYQADGWGGSAGSGPLVGSHSHHFTAWTSGNLGGSFSGNGGIRNDGNNLTDPIYRVQHTIMMHYMVKT